MSSPSPSPSRNPHTHPPEVQWPPRSPFHALLSSPTGRRRWQDHRARRNSRSPSPSPIRRSAGDSRLLKSLQVEDDNNEQEEEEEDGEDEEMVRLRLERIEARMKLKRMQKAAKKRSSVDRAVEKCDSTASKTDSVMTSRANTGTTSPRKLLNPSSSQPRIRQDDVQVAVSPTKDHSQPKEQLSPARLKLGASKLRMAQEVSLKRARSGGHHPHPGPQPSEQRYRHGTNASEALSFSERLARSKGVCDDKKTKMERIEKLRSTGFTDRAATIPVGPQLSRLNNGPDQRSNTDIKRPLSAHHAHSSRQLDQDTSIGRSSSVHSSRSGRSSQPRGMGLFASRKAPPETTEPDSYNDSTADKHGAASPGFDPFSQTHLKKRNISHVDVARAMEGKEIYTVPRLLKEVQSPHYDPPDCECDFVVFAILASKSTPLDQKSTHRTSDDNKPQEDPLAPRNKFMVFCLCDLKWEVDCFVFGTAFDQFWKLTPGTLLAILNPAIMPPKTNQHNGRFSLKLGSSEDCVMEIGVARDLGFCVSAKKDGRECNAWIDKRSTEVCEFHLNLMIDKNRKHRMEVNGMWRGISEGEQKTRRHVRASERPDQNNKQRGTYHREYGQLYTVPSGYSASTASLLDVEDAKALQDRSQEEASRKRIANAQKERDLAKKLGEIGNGVGAEYLRAKHGLESTSTVAYSKDLSAAEARALFEKPSAAELGLLGKKASDQHLSPTRDRKRLFGPGATSTSGPEAMGWGGARKAGLLQPKESKLGSPERGQSRIEFADRSALGRPRSKDGSLSPKKRARFALEKGIREPGRESLGEDLRQKELAGDNNDDEDDDLDIV